MKGSPHKRRTVIASIISLTALVSLTVCGLVWGASSVSLLDAVALVSGQDVSATARNILLNVRMPRVLAGMLAGAALASAGALIQAVLDNPLASPNVIGINSGAGLAVLLAGCAFPGVLWLRPLAAFAGACVSALLVFAIASGTRGSRITIVLAGIAITTVFGAGMNTVLIVNPDAYVGSSVFLVGGLSSVMMRDVIWALGYIAVGLAVAIALSTHLNMLSLGDDTAHALGMNVPVMRIGALGTAAVLAGAAVSFAGVLGFVGLIVPHIVRFVVGHDNRVVVPLSALVGASFVVGCDLLARVLFAPYELPVGILMAFIGGPFFIFLVYRNRKDMGV